VPEGILNVLKLLFLALLYLFLARVVRVVYLEVTGPRRAAAFPATPTPATPGPARPSKAVALRLRVVEPPEGAGRLYPLGEEVTVGRAPGCGVVLTDDTYVSQLHARIYSQDGDLLVEDLGSTNGTYVNRERLNGSTRIKKGDRLQIGTTVMEVVR
jgi:pSer/pThr/pTyr-binding forkhead associated (FHA) protein